MRDALSHDRSKEHSTWGDCGEYHLPSMTGPACLIPYLQEPFPRPLGKMEAETQALAGHDIVPSNLRGDSLGPTCPGPHCPADSTRDPSLLYYIL